MDRRTNALPDQSRDSANYRGALAHLKMPRHRDPSWVVLWTTPSTSIQRTKYSTKELRLSVQEEEISCVITIF